MIDTPHIEQARQQIRKAEKPILVRAQDDVFNRKILDYGKFDVLVSPEAGTRKAGMRNVDSGLNEVMARIAAKKGIKIGIEISALEKLSPVEKSERIARIMQNARIARRCGTSFALIGSARNAQDTLLSFGFSTQQAKEAVTQRF